MPGARIRSGGPAIQLWRLKISFTNADASVS